MTKDKVYEKLIKSVDDWEFTRYNAIYKPLNISYWIANGLSFFSIDSGARVGIGFMNWIKLWFWLKETRRKQILEKK